jgi:hypothetical protein
MQRAVVEFKSGKTRRGFSDRKGILRPCIYRSARQLVRISSCCSSVGGRRAVGLGRSRSAVEKTNAPVLYSRGLSSSAYQVGREGDRAQSHGED